MSTNLKDLIINIKQCNEEIARLNVLKQQYKSEFFNKYPIELTEEKVTWVNYYGEEYIVTEVNFNDFTVLLETDPYMDDNEVVKVSFELFAEIYKEFHRDILINR